MVLQPKHGNATVPEGANKIVPSLCPSSFSSFPSCLVVSPMEEQVWWGGLDPKKFARMSPNHLQVHNTKRTQKSTLAKSNWISIIPNHSYSGNQIPQKFKILLLGFWQLSTLQLGLLGGLWHLGSVPNFSLSQWLQCRSETQRRLNLMNLYAELRHCIWSKPTILYIQYSMMQVWSYRLQNLDSLASDTRPWNFLNFWETTQRSLQLIAVDICRWLWGTCAKQAEQYLVWQIHAHQRPCSPSHKWPAESWSKDIKGTAVVKWPTMCCDTLQHLKLFGTLHIEQNFSCYLLCIIPSWTWPSFSSPWVARCGPSALRHTGSLTVSSCGLTTSKHPWNMLRSTFVVLWKMAPKGANFFFANLGDIAGHNFRKAQQSAWTNFPLQLQLGLTPIFHGPWWSIAEAH